MPQKPNTGSPLLVAFVAAPSGDWAVQSVTAVVGGTLEAAPRLSMVEGGVATPGSPTAVWTLRGVVSHLRYTTAPEAELLAREKPPLGRPEARCAALIPIRKSPAWWALPQDERRAIFEERSRHTTIGLEYLPRIARRLHHGRDLGEPFDFLTWFEFAPEHQDAFDELVVRLRMSEEWRFVEREVDIRLTQGR